MRALPATPAGPGRLRRAAMVVLSTLALLPVTAALAGPGSDRLPSDALTAPPPVGDTREQADGDGAAGTTGDGAVPGDSATVPVAPGVEHTSFQVDESRLEGGSGPVRGDLLTVDLTEERIAVDLLTPGAVSASAPLSEMVERQGAVAGITGDFFDITTTDAAFGPEIADGALRKGPDPGHGRVVGVGTDGIGRLASVSLEGALRLPGGERRLDGLNQSRLPEDGIGAFTPVWGTGSRGRAVEGAARTHEVVVEDGAVVASHEGTTDAPIPPRGFVLVGRERGGTELAGLGPGDPVDLAYGADSDAPAPFVTALGGREVLVRDGEVATTDRDASHPRTAVGISAEGTRMLLVTIDGRQTGSRGMRLTELADLMVDLGAAQALNLDGGGSSTMVARHPGTEPRVVSSPSDGEERPAPNGLGIMVRPGSGTLRALRVQPAAASADADRVFPGLTRTLTATGHDESYAPVEARPRWSVVPAGAGGFTAPGVLEAARTGALDAVATDGDVRGSATLRVLGRLAGVEADPGRLSLSGPGDTAGLRITGVDAQGARAPVEPRDLDVAHDPDVVAVGPDGPGGLAVEAVTDSGSTVLEVTVGAHTARVPVSVGSTTTRVSEMESLRGWSTFAAEATSAITSVPGRSGSGIRLDYDFTRSTSTRAAYLLASPTLELSGATRRIGVHVRGDGNGAWLRAQVEDADGIRHTLSLAETVDWTGWRWVEATIPDDARQPVGLRFLAAVETGSGRQYTGSLVFDDVLMEVAGHPD